MRMPIGAAIRQVREKRGISQETLAKLVKMTNSGISKLEKDPNEGVPFRTVRAIAAALDVPLQELVALTESEEPSPSSFRPEMPYDRIPLAVRSVLGGDVDTYFFDRLTKDEQALSRLLAVIVHLGYKSRGWWPNP